MHARREGADGKAGTAAIVTLMLAGAVQAHIPSAGDSLGGSPIERSAYPYSSIGFVESQHPVAWRTGQKVLRSRLTGTAFLVSPCYALTAFHVVFGNDPATVRQASEHTVWVSFGGRGRRFSLDRVNAEVVAWGDYAEDQTQDWALLKVAGCPGGLPNIGWLDFAGADAPLENRAARVGGFSSYRRALQFVGDTQCRLRWRSDRMTIANQCFGEPGMSGAPILVWDANEQVKVAAIVSRSLSMTFAHPEGVPIPPLNLAVVVHAALQDQSYYPRILADRPMTGALQFAALPGDDRPRVARHGM